MEYLPLLCKSFTIVVERHVAATRESAPEAERPQKPARKWTPVTWNPQDSATTSNAPPATRRRRDIPATVTSGALAAEEEDPSLKIERVFRARGEAIAAARRARFGTSPVRFIDVPATETSPIVAAANAAFAEKQTRPKRSWSPIVWNEEDEKRSAAGESRPKKKKAFKIGWDESEEEQFQRALRLLDEDNGDF